MPASLKPAIILLSGGLDSATVLAIAQTKGFACHALSFDYGQRHRHELEAANKIAAAAGVTEHKSAKIDLTIFGGSALTDATIAVPKDQLATATTMSKEIKSQPIPITYVPARNTIFLSFALAYAETRAAFDLFLGVNALDYSGYPDCRPEYISAFERLANLATKAGMEAGGQGFKIHTPLITLKKSEIIKEGLRMGVPYHLTHSCYDPVETAAGIVSCGHCDSCLLRLQGFHEAGALDPIAYQ